MYRDTITLFNRYESRLGDMWFPTVLNGVNLNIDRASIVARMGAESQDRVIVNVRYMNIDGKKMIEGKEYLTPKIWDAQVVEELPNTLTFTPDSEKFDFFLVGEYDDSQPINDDDYPDGFFDYISNQFDYVFAITSVSEFSVIPHFELTGK